MEGPPSSLRHARPGWTLALTSVAFFMVALDSLVVVTALPSMQRDLGATLSTLEWTINSFTLAFAAGIITAAALGDRFGRRRVFTVGLTVFTVASVACAVAPTASALIVARTLQGIGAAMVMPLSLTILTSAFPAERRGAVIGIWGGIGGLAVASGPLVGGAVTQGLDWHWIFWINVPIGLIAVLLAHAHLPESHGPATRIDPAAVALVSGSAIAIVWGLIRAGDTGWRSPEVVAALCVGVVLAAAFVAWERRARDPMLPLDLFRSRTFAAANLTAFLMAGAIFSAAFLVAQYMQFGLGYSPLATGLRLLPWTATPLVVAPIAGMLADKVGNRPVLVTGMLLQGIGLGWFATLATAAATYGQLVTPLIVAGLGISMALPVVPTAILGAVSPKDMGKASGVNSTLQRFGAAFAIAIASAVFVSNGHLGTPASFTTGFRPALAVVAGLSVLGAMTALAVGSRRRQPAIEHAVSAVSF
ncbi:MAG: DHA2 family efflux MFS transporter permease subunit [Candidatus Dormibacteraceae bacterium]